jgi:hypothetical protein
MSGSGAAFPAGCGVQNRPVMQNPPSDRGMIHGQPSLGHHLLKIAIAEWVPQVPADTQSNDFVAEVSSTEQRWPVRTHSLPPYQKVQDRFATLRSKQRTVVPVLGVGQRAVEGRGIEEVARHVVPSLSYVEYPFTPFFLLKPVLRCAGKAPLQEAVRQHEEWPAGSGSAKHCAVRGSTRSIGRPYLIIDVIAGCWPASRPNRAILSLRCPAMVAAATCPSARQPEIGARIPLLRDRHRIRDFLAKEFAIPLAKPVNRNFERSL